MSLVIAKVRLQPLIVNDTGSAEKYLEGNFCVISIE